MQKIQNQLDNLTNQLHVISQAMNTQSSDSDIIVLGRSDVMRSFPILNTSIDFELSIRKSKYLSRVHTTLTGRTNANKFNKN